ncbi:MAG: AAA family ATPase [Candidatus Nanopelagicales bacterium]|nr:AAA family ATPase [Candidatus Nanopelagicales bacterium]
MGEQAARLQPGGRSRPATPPFVGREQELAALEDVWRTVTQGSGQAVFVGGEAGGGKSRLVSEAATLLREHGVPVVTGRCVAELGSTYDPFVEPVAALLGRLGPGALGRAVADGTALAGGASPAELLGLITTGTTAADPPVGVLQPALFGAVVRALATAAAEGAVLLVLEDLQWAGDGGLRLLRHLVERIEDIPVLILATVRTEPSDAATRVRGLVSDLMRVDAVHRWDLPGLTTREITEYLVRGSGMTPSAARRAASLLRDQTAGNPFLLREVCRDHAADLAAGDLAGAAVRAPEAFQASTRARLGRLAGPDQDLVRMAAVLGEEFDVPLLVACRDAPSGPSDRAPAAPVFHALESARALGLVEWVPARGGVARFPHALARQAVLDLMTQYELASAHARAAHALERLPTAERRVERLAHHYAGAAALGYAEQATDWLHSAADAALARLSHADAAALYERGAEHATTPLRRDALLLLAARAHLRAGGFRRVRELAELVAANGAPEQLLLAAILFEAAAFFGYAHDARPRSIELLATGLERSGEGHDARNRVVATAALARATSFTERADRSPALREAALRQARQLGEPQLVAEVLAICLLDARAHVRIVEALQLADELSALVSDPARGGDGRGATGGDRVVQLGPAAFVRCLAHYTLGNPAGLEAAHRDLERVAQATGEPYWALPRNFVAFNRQLMACAFADARATLDQTARLLSAVEGGHLTEGPWSIQSFMLRRETGHLAGVRHLITGREDPATTWAPGLLALYTEFEMAEPARRLLHALLETDLEAREHSASWPTVLSFLVDAAAWLHDEAAARALLPLAHPFVGRNLVAEMIVVLGSGDRLVGALASVLDDPSAEEHFAAALAMDARMAAPLHRATTLAQYVTHLRRAGGEAAQRALPLEAQARVLCERHQLVRVARLLGPGGAAGRDELRPDGLTPREAEVLALLGRGRSNREIAATLVISEYTAANHVRSILMKTGCANRTQAAMYAVEHGLVSATR